jgi:pyrimidine-nucleoside phosphorylase
MNAPELIRKKRNGGKLSREEIEFLINGYLSGSVAEYQISALLMAIYYQKMNFEETAYLTEFILHSGQTIDLSEIPGIKVGKHSTGGVGDKVSIILGPMVAACGVTVSMLSGRALGHTGGTLDKLESIPGYRVGLSPAEFKNVLRNVGVSIMGQTDDIAPADKKLYALRDVTATVDSIPLIASSIMSKKLAEGIDALVLDVKVGRGAVLPNEADATELANMLTGIGNKFSKKVFCFITSMDQPLGYAVGNWLEIVECVDCLKGKEVSDLMELTYALGGTMVMLGKKAATITEGIDKCREAIQNGSAWNKFLVMVKAQGGDIRYLENPDIYPRSRFTKEVKAGQTGWVNSIDALEIGLSSHSMGSGRTRADSAIDLKAGIILKKKIGDPVKKDEILAICYSDDQEKIESAAKRIDKAFRIFHSPPAPPALVRARPNDQGLPVWNT